MTMPRRVIAAVAVFVLASAGCAAAPRVTGQQKQLLEANVAAPDVPINVKKGDPAPANGVWMSVPYAQSVVDNMTAWQVTKAECLAQLEKCPDGAPSMTTMALLGGAGVVVGALLTLGLKVAFPPRAAESR